jgi:hypothetical protein
VFYIASVFVLAGCSGFESSTLASTTNHAPTGPPFTLTGTITYDWVPANANGASGALLDYSAIIPMPARRVVVRAMSNGFVEGETTTDDIGNFSLYVPTGRAVQVQALAKISSTSYVKDGLGASNTEACNGSSWDVRVVDNTNSRAQWAVMGANFYQKGTTGVAVNAPLNYSGGAYTSRAAAPFAILDSIVSVFELACQGKADITFPILYVNWSPLNSTNSGNLATGAISTSFFTDSSNENALYLLGEEGVDTDEYDDHVIAHETGHYLEAALFRSDSVGGSHSLGQSLDPRVAFGEGYGNAISAMTFSDPVYVDTNGTGQGSGFTIQVDQAPTGDDRGHYSERSAEYFLWTLFDNGDGIAANNLGLFVKIYNIMANFQRSTNSFTSLLSFASYYNQVYGGASEGLQGLWTTSLGLPYNALCVGTCSGTGDAADPYDTDNDIGVSFASGAAGQRRFPQTTGSTYSSEFWRVVRTLSSGLNTGTAHESMVDGAYTYPYNRLGMVRWYKLVGTGNQTTVAVESTAGGCTSDTLDMYISKSGVEVGYDDASSGLTAGCPIVTFSSTLGATYMIDIRGFSNVSTFDLRVTE